MQKNTTGPNQIQIYAIYFKNHKIANNSPFTKKNVVKLTLTIFKTTFFFRQIHKGIFDMGKFRAIIVTIRLIITLSNSSLLGKVIWHQKFVQFCPTFSSCLVGQKCANFWILWILQVTL